MVTECCSESRMRSRTSRGVPEWSGGKDLYMGCPVLVTKKVSGATRWGHQPQKAAWAKCGRGPAPGGLVRPHQGPRRVESGKGANPGSRWALRPTLGRPPLFPPWPHPRWVLGAAATPRDGTLDGGAAPPLPLYILGVFGAAIHRRSSTSWRSPTSLPPRLS